MILVLLGTQDMRFDRLIKAVEKAKLAQIINDEIVVQAGYTTYDSKVLTIRDFIGIDEFNQLVATADLVITHGGVGSILQAIKAHKKVIAMPRLKKYHEHHNNHQLEICAAFEKLGYIQVANDEKALLEHLGNLATFKPKAYRSNNTLFCEQLRKIIEE